MIERVFQWFRQAQLLQALKAEIRLMERTNSKLSALNAKQRECIQELEAALEEARKNDHRGTDGRFKAAPKKLELED